MIPLSVFPFPSAPCHKRVVSYPIIAFCCRSFNLSIAALPWGRFSFVQPLSLLRRQGRVAAPSVCCAAACILLAAAPTATPCFRRWRRSSPLGPRPAGCKRQRSRRWEPQPGLVERSETERLYEGKPDREPLLDSTSPSALTRCHLPYRGEALAFRKAWPLRQRLPY